MGQKIVCGPGKDGSKQILLEATSPLRLDLLKVPPPFNTIRLIQASRLGQGLQHSKHNSNTAEGMDAERCEEVGAVVLIYCCVSASSPSLLFIPHSSFASSPKLPLPSLGH